MILMLQSRAGFTQVIQSQYLSLKARSLCTTMWHLGRIKSCFLEEIALILFSEKTIMQLLSLQNVLSPTLSTHFTTSQSAWDINIRQVNSTTTGWDCGHKMERLQHVLIQSQKVLRFFMLLKDSIGPFKFESRKIPMPSPLSH